MRRAAERLVAQGIVSRRVAGRSRLYSLNRQHLAARPIQELANLREQLIGKLRQLLPTWKPKPVAAAMFGSVARGAASEVSDLDLLIVRRDDVDPDLGAWRDAIDALARDVTAWTGNDTRILEVSEREALSADAERVVVDAVRDGINLLGAQGLRRRMTMSAR